MEFPTKSLDMAKQNLQGKPVYIYIKMNVCLSVCLYSMDSKTINPITAKFWKIIIHPREDLCEFLLKLVLWFRCKVRFLFATLAYEWLFFQLWYSIYKRRVPYEERRLTEMCNHSCENQVHLRPHILVFHILPARWAYGYTNRRIRRKICS